MRAIVGLGNPGPRYRHTRHNVGWWTLDELARRWGAGKAKPEKARHAEVVRCTVDGEPLVLVKPQTFMNDSGKAVRALVEKDKLKPEEIMVVYDDIDLAAGRIRIRSGGSSGGHRGLKSIQEHLAQVMRSRKPKAPPGETGGGPAAKEESPEFPRIKVGLGRPPAGVDPIDYVLTTFTPDELAVVKPAVERTADAIECWLREGIDVAMNRFNGAA
jgi:PTH1 family peptidyl-tRNA hydrolase